jgi:hypothetical protein
MTYIKSLTVLIGIIALVISSFFIFKPQEAKAYESADICTHYVPRVNDCIWHPVNCACDIIVTPQEK